MNLLPIVRSVIVAVIYPTLVIGFAIFVVALGMSPATRRAQDHVIAAWCRWSLFLFGVRVVGRGLEKIPEGPYLALFNHSSNFDIFAIQSLIPRIRFGAKIELFHIPIFGQAMRAARALPIARSNREEVLQVYREAQARFAQGECFILAPEGTRQTDEKLGPFKAGPFLFAIEGQVPVVPIAVIGANAVQSKKVWLPNTHRWSSTIEVRVGEPIATKSFSETSRKGLQEQVRSALLSLGLRE